MTVYLALIRLKKIIRYLTHTISEFLIFSFFSQPVLEGATINQLENPAPKKKTTTINEPQRTSALMSDKARMPSYSKEAFEKSKYKVRCPKWNNIGSLIRKDAIGNGPPALWCTKCTKQIDSSTTNIEEVVSRDDRSPTNHGLESNNNSDKQTSEHDLCGGSEWNDVSDNKSTDQPIHAGNRSNHHINTKLDTEITKLRKEHTSLLDNLNRYGAICLCGTWKELRQINNGVLLLELENKLTSVCSILKQSQLRCNWETITQVAKRSAYVQTMSPKMSKYWWSYARRRYRYAI